MPQPFCTDISHAAQEPMQGTGKHPDRMLLVVWPKRAWRYAMRIAEDMPPDVVAAIEAATEAGWRVNLIDRKADGAPIGTVFAFPMARRFAVPEGELAALISALVAGHPPQEGEPAGRMLLCCTHGKHDRCCARFGFAAFKALSAAAAGQGISVWECTHLGGCRFAATALALPSLHKYGRITPEAAAQIVAAEAAGQVYLPCLRGIGSHLPAAQVAEFAVLSQGGETQAAPARQVTILSETETRAVVEVTTRTGAHQVTLTPGHAESHNSCTALAEGAEKKLRQPWQVCRIVTRGAVGA